MDSQIRTRNLRSKVGLSLAVLLGVGATTSLLTTHAKADTWDKMTKVTFSEPVQVMNTYLPAGTYMFRLLDWQRHIIAVTNGDRSKPYAIILAIPAHRTFPTEKAEFTFWETPPGSVKAVRYWWYPGDEDGQEFTYPGNLRQVAAVTSSPAPQQPATQAEAAPAPQPVNPEPAPAPPAVAQNNEETAPQPPVEIAQNQPPAPAPAPQAEPQSNQQQQQLPKTASPYPMIGLAGLLSLGSYLGLRFKLSR